MSRRNKGLSTCFAVTFCTTDLQVRAKAASTKHNISFLHYALVGMSSHGPVACDCLAVFVFTSDGLLMKQAVTFRSAACIQEYAAEFSMPMDVLKA